MQAARLLDALLAGLILLAFLHRCDAAPAASSAIAKALPSVVPPDSSVLRADAWASRSVYNVTQRNTNNTVKRTRVSRRDDWDFDWDFDYIAHVSDDDQHVYHIYPLRNDEPLDYIAQLYISNNTLGSGSQGHVVTGWLYQYSEDENSEDKDSEGCDSKWKLVAVKTSRGSADYRNARIFSTIESQYIVKVHIYALNFPTTGIGSRRESLVAYEKLEVSAYKAWLLGSIDQIPFMRAAIDGAIDATRHDIWILDLKFDNYMSKTQAVGADAQWAVIDLGMMVKGHCLDSFDGYAGTYGYMPPEMVKSKLDPEGHSEFQAGPAQVFNIAIMFLYLQNGRFEGTVTQDMQDISSKLFEGRQLRDKDYRWHWIALLVAYTQKKDSPSEIPLPSKYTDDPRYHEWGRWYRKTLCGLEDRYVHTVFASYHLDNII